MTGYARTLIHSIAATAASTAPALAQYGATAARGVPGTGVIQAGSVQGAGDPAGWLLAVAIAMGAALGLAHWSIFRRR